MYAGAAWWINAAARKADSIGFLCFYSEHRAEALVRAKLLTRQFLREGTFAAVNELVEERSIFRTKSHACSEELHDDGVGFVVGS